MIRTVFTATLMATAVLALAACSPADEEPAAVPPTDEIESSTAPSVGGPAALPTDGGVTPAPEAVEDATAADMAAPASPEKAAALSGGAEKAPSE